MPSHICDVPHVSFPPAPMSSGNTESSLVRNMARPAMVPLKIWLAYQVYSPYTIRL